VWIAPLANGKVARSTDNGATWTEIDAGFVSSAANCVATDRNGVWIAGSTDSKISYSNKPYVFDSSSQFLLPDLPVPQGLNALIKAEDIA